MIVVLLSYGMGHFRAPPGAQHAGEGGAAPPPQRQAGWRRHEAAHSLSGSVKSIFQSTPSLIVLVQLAGGGERIKGYFWGNMGTVPI